MKTRIMPSLRRTKDTREPPSTRAPRPNFIPIKCFSTASQMCPANSFCGRVFSSTRSEKIRSSLKHPLIGSFQRRCDPTEHLKYKLFVSKRVKFDAFVKSSCETTGSIPRGGGGVERPGSPNGIRRGAAFLCAYEVEGNLLMATRFVCGHKAVESKRSMARCYKRASFHARPQPEYQRLLFKATLRPFSSDTKRAPSSLPRTDKDEIIYSCVHSRSR